jgi:signal transduction histidine kinase
MDGSVPLFGASPRRALVGLFVGFAVIATALVILDSTVARAVVAVAGLVLLAAIGWFVLQGQFSTMFDVLTHVDEDGLPAPVDPKDMPQFAPLAAAVMAREDRAQELRTVLADLRATRERLALTLEVATQGLFEIHYEPGSARIGEGQYFVSGLEFFGVPVDELVERDITELNSRAKPENRLSFQHAALANGGADAIYGVDIQYQNLEDEWRWLSIRGRTLESVDGDPVRILAVLNDITYRKELERRAAHSDTMRSLGHLVSGLSHDLNNVLAVVRVNAELLLDFDVSRDDSQRLALRTREMADDGFDLLRGLLELTRMEDQTSDVDLGLLVSRVAESFRDLAPNDVGIEVRRHAEHALVHVDRARLDQVVLNLGLNAIDAMDDHGQLTLTTRRLHLRSDNNQGLASGDYVALDVTDDGSGIDPAVIDTLFEPFVSTKSPGTGRGLGLATSFDTVSHAGGTMSAANNVESPGATVTVVLPLVPVMEPDEPMQDEQSLAQ